VVRDRLPAFLDAAPLSEAHDCDETEARRGHPSLFPFVGVVVGRLHRPGFVSPLT
jgi:hypothetical protein